MKNNKTTSNQINEHSLEEEFEGAYGKYKITLEDKLEVRRYRIAVLICGISFTSGIGHWLIAGPTYAWLWLIPMSISLGLALKWIHIYIKIIHQTLQLLWALGSVLIIFLVLRGDPNQFLSNLSINRIQLLAIGPFFAALTGLGFKEFFCFRQPEAIGVTLLLPISLLSYTFRIFPPTVVMILLGLSSILLLMLGLKKFRMDPALDLGDKSIFEYLNKVKKANISGI